MKKNLKRSSWLILSTLFSFFYLFNGEECYCEEGSSISSLTSTDSIITTKAKALSRYRPSESAVIGDDIEITVQHLKNLLSDTVFLKQYTNAELVINGSSQTGIVSDNVNFENGTIIFHIDTSAAGIKKLKERMFSQWDKYVTCSLSAKMGGKVLKSSIVSFKIYFITPKIYLHAVLILIIIILSIYLLAVYTNIMRGGSDKSAFSLAQVQLTIWTITVATAVLYIWLLTGNLPDLTPSVLALMGISVATTAGGKMVRISIKGDSPFIETPSKGFFRDIISDDKSTNIQRFQMVVWTFILVFIFIFKILIKRQICDFSESYLILTGISSSAYVLLKYTENKPSERPGETVPEDKKIPSMG